VLQALAESLLTLRRQAAKGGIILQGTFLFGRGKIFVTPQPVPGMPLLPKSRIRVRSRLPRWLCMRCRYAWRGSSLVLRRRVECTFLCEGWTRGCHGECPHCGCHTSQDVSSPRHYLLIPYLLVPKPRPCSELLPS